MKSQVSLEQRDWIFRIESDAFALNLFTSLLVSIPQIILQLYIMAMLQHVSFWTSKYYFSFLFIRHKSVCLYRHPLSCNSIYQAYKHKRENPVYKF